MAENGKGLQAEDIVGLVKRITERKLAERAGASAVEEARRLIRSKGRFIPKVPIKKGLRISF